MSKETMETTEVRPVPIPYGLDEYLHGHLYSSAYPRTAEKAKLMDAHKAGMNPLVICGEHGSGTTFLAKDLARDLTKNIDSKQNPCKTYLLPFDGSLRKTISNYHIPLYVLLPVSGWSASDEEIAQQRYNDKLSLLKQVPEGSVFILDGVNTLLLSDVFNEPEFTTLLSLGTVIITSSDTSSFPEWVINPVPDECALKPLRDPGSYMPAERVVLQNAALVPPTGLHMPPFSLAQGKENEDAVLKMILEGSLKISANQKILPTDCSYSGNDEDYSHFLMYLHHLAKKSNTSQQDYEEICQVFKNAACFLEDKDGLIAWRAGQLFRARGDYIEAIPLYERFLLKQKHLEPQDPIMLAQALYDVGCIRAFHALNHKNGNRSELLEEGTTMLLHALKLQEGSLNRGNIDLTKTRLALAQIGVDVPGYQDSAELASFALTEQLTVLSADHREIAETLLELANMHQGVFTERKIRKSYVEQALAIVDKWDLDTTQAEAYSIMADTYSMMSDCLTYSALDKRIELLRRALEIREKHTPHERHALYIEHQHLGWLYNRNRDYQHEVVELSAAIEILTEMLPPNHPRIQRHLKELEVAKLRAGSEAN